VPINPTPEDLKLASESPRREGKNGIFRPTNAMSANRLHPNEECATAMGFLDGWLSVDGADDCQDVDGMSELRYE